LISLDNQSYLEPAEDKIKELVNQATTDTVEMLDLTITHDTKNQWYIADSEYNTAAGK